MLIIYAKHKNFLLDIKLVLLTLVAIFFPKTAVTLVKQIFIEKHKPDLMPAINEWIKWVYTTAWPKIEVGRIAIIIGDFV